MNPYPTVETNTERIAAIKRIVTAMLMATIYMQEHPNDCTCDGLMQTLRTYTLSEVEAQAAGMLLASELRTAVKP